MAKNLKRVKKDKLVTKIYSGILLVLSSFLATISIQCALTTIFYIVSKINSGVQQILCTATIFYKREVYRSETGRSTAGRNTPFVLMSVCILWVCFYQ